MKSNRSMNTISRWSLLFRRRTRY